MSLAAWEEELPSHGIPAQKLPGRGGGERGMCGWGRPGSPELTS